MNNIGKLVMAALVICGPLGTFAAGAIVELPVGPYVHFNNQDEVTIHWKTDTAVASVVQYGTKPNLTDTVTEATPKTDHELTIPILPETEHSYRIMVGANNTETFWFYSAFDYGPGTFPAGPSPYTGNELYEQAAIHILNETGINKGVCIDYGCGDGRLAYELAKRSDLQIIGFDPSGANVAAARDYLDQAGIYGKRVTVLSGNLSSLKCRNYSANLIVSAEMITASACPGDAAELYRILRPAGGVAMLGRPPAGSLSQATLEGWLGAGSVSYSTTVDGNGLWSRVDRGPLAGAGEWTHYYADVGNTAATSEANITNSMKLLWYGEPGPRYVIDRHHRPPSPLYKNGLVVDPGYDGISAFLTAGQGVPDYCFGRLMAFDAYNGARYWDVLVPNGARVNILRDCGAVAMADDYTYAVSNKNCVGLDAKTGRPTIHLATPDVSGIGQLTWGYVAVVDDKIYGTGQEETASLVGLSRDQINEIYWDNKPIATSRYLFCRDRTTGSLQWSYKRNGGSVIINPCIAIDGNYIYFIESRNSTAISDSDGRVPAATLFSGSNEYLVKLNRNTGAESYAVLIDLPFQHMAYLSYADNKLVAVGSWYSGGYKYENRAYDPSDGSLTWSSNYNIGNTGNSHGEQDQHPCFVGGTLYSRQYKVDMSSGTASGFALARGNCGTQSGCPTHLFGRNFNGYMFELPSGTARRVTQETRVSCWINMVPAGGLLLVPDGGSGCNCSYPFQASMAFTPQ